MNLIHCLPIAISVLALWLSLYTYVKHDRKIKKLTLDKLEKEIELDKRAIVEVYVKGEKGKRIIQIYNRGRATAKNVRVTFPENSDVNLSEYLSVTDINPQNSMDIYVSINYCTPSTLQVDYEWEDGVKLDNKGSQVIQLR